MTGTVKESNAEFFNKRLTTINTEVEPLTAKIEYLKVQSSNSDNTVPDIAEKIIGEMETLSQAMIATNKDPALCRQAIDAYVKTVDALPDGSFNINFVLEQCSTSRKENGCPTRI